MALQIGAGFYHPGTVGGLRACPEDAVWNPDHIYNNLAGLGNLGIMVDEFGDRWFDESIYAEEKLGLYSQAHHTEGVTGMVVVDGALYKANNSIQQAIAAVLQFKGTVYQENTIDAIASDALNDANLGLRLGRQQDLVSTVSAYNAAIAAGTNMSLRPARKANLNQLTTAPFYAVPFTLVQISSTDGLLCNANGEVLDRYSTVQQSSLSPPSGSVIPGLYAAGEIMASNLGTGPNGTIEHENTATSGQLCVGLVFGMLSGESAAEYVTSLT
jgi:hypothetical protein